MNKKIFSLSGLLFILFLIPGYGQTGGFQDIEWLKDVGAREIPSSRGIVYHVTDFGAIGDGSTLCTEAIQKAIDACASNGGGTVSFKTGIYLTGSIFLKSNVILDIPKGVQLSGSQEIKDYPDLSSRVAGLEMTWPAALINIIDQENVAITGEGVVHGYGKVFWDKYRAMRKEYDPKGLRWVVDYDCKRPRGILISNSKDITLKDFVLYQAGFWSVHILYSSYVTVDGLIINNNIGGHGPSTDGIDIDSSTRILVQNCYVNCNDDNFCMKAGRDADGLKVNRPCEYIVIRDCVAGHGDGLFTCGSETSGGIRNVLVYNMKGIGTKYGLRFKSTATRGGTIENIYLYNIEMTGVRDPFVVNLNWHPAYSTSILPEGYDYETLPDHWKKLLEKVDPEQGMPKFKNIHFRDVKATGAKTCVKVGGLKESTIENFSLTNVSIEGKNAGKISYAKDWKTVNFSVKAENGELEMENNKNIDL
jgi:polygalacturonase